MPRPLALAVLLAVFTLGVVLARRGDPVVGTAGPAPEPPPAAAPPADLAARPRDAAPAVRPPAGPAAVGPVGPGPAVPAPALAPPGLVVLAAESRAPLVGVHVLRVQKSSGGGVDEDAAAEPDVAGVTDAAGRLPWSALSPRGAWGLVALYGRRAVVLDGDAVDPAADREVVVEPAPTLEIVATTADGTTPVPFAAVGFAPVEGADARVAATLGAPAPLAAFWRGGFTEVGEDGRATLPVGVPFPVRVEMAATREDRYWEPAGVDVEGPGPSLRFRALPACRVALRLADRDGDRPVRGRCTLELRGGAAASPRRATLADAGTAGEASLFPHLPPGAYTLDVDVEGYEPSRGHVVELPAPGARATVVVTLRADPARAPAVLRLRCPVEGPDGPSFAPSADPSAAPPIVMVRAVAPDVRAWAVAADEARPPEAGADPRRGGDARTWDLRLAPGTWDVLVLDPPRGLVGGARGLVVSAGATAEATVPLARGVDLGLASHLGAHGRARDLRAEDAAGAPWPLVEVRPAGLQFDDVRPEATGADRLAPLPGPTVRVRYVDAAGAARVLERR